MQPATENKVRSFKSLKDEIRQAIWPSGEQENLITAHDQMFIEGMGQIQKWVTQEQQVNCNVIRFCKTYHKMGMTVVPAPKGIVMRVYTVCDDDWNRPVYFYPRPWPEPEEWSKRLRGQYFPLYRGKERLPVGFQYAEPWHDLKHGLFSDGDIDPDDLSSQAPVPPGVTPYQPPVSQKKHDHHRFERAKHGIYSIHDKNIYLAPWIQSKEMVVVEWYGIKTSSEWTDDDLISDAVDMRNTLKLWVQFAHERDYGEMDMAKEYHNSEGTGMFDEALADMMWQNREETKHRRNALPSRHSHFSFIDAQLLNNAARQLGLINPHQHPTNPNFPHHLFPRDEDDVIVIAHIGNNGCGTPSSDLVSFLARMWNPHFVIATGGNTAHDPIPAVLSATSISPTEIDLSWTPAILNFPASYSVYGSTDPNFTVSPDTLLASGLSASTLSYKHTGLTASTTYYYIVQATDVLGESALSNEANATTGYILTAPFLSGYAFNGFEIILGWTASMTSLPPTGNLYSVYRGNTANFNLDQTTLVVQSNNLDYIDGAPFVTPGNTYYYIVTATDSEGHVVRSNEIQVLLPITGVGPSKPSVVATAVSTTEIDLTWGASSGTAPITYDVYASTVAGFTPGPSNKIASALSTTSYPHTGLSPLTHWYYYVVANNAYGTSVSNRADATTFGIPPTAPSLMATEASPTQINLSWSPAGGSAPITYTCYRSLNPTDTPPSGTVVFSNFSGTTFNDTTVTNADTTQYYYYVVASNAWGTAQSNKAFNSLWLIPVMTDDTHPSGTASATTNNNIAWLGFGIGSDVVVDPNFPGNTWHDNSGDPLPMWLKYDFGATPVIVTKYYVYFTCPLSGNVGWQLQGSNDGSSWTTLDTQSASTNASGLPRNFNTVLGSPATFSKFRILINTFGPLGFGELIDCTFQLYGGH